MRKKDVMTMVITFEKSSVKRMKDSGALTMVGEKA